ncbi:MAG: hypothetical protein ABI553_07245 [Chloroflexota bacterium]
MARLTTTHSLGHRRRVLVGAALVVALVAFGAVRVMLGGWAPLAADDARYLYVGLSILDGHGPVGPSGTVFLLRSPIYGLALALGSPLGSDPVAGARIVAATLGLLGLTGAGRLGWRLAGPGGAIGTAVALVSIPLVWNLIPSLRIDLTQTAVIVAALLAISRPTIRRWAIGGALIGLAILVKETAAPILILPVALLGSVPRPHLARITLAFIGAAAIVAGWWWVVVWVSSGQVFPFNALAVIETRDVDVAIRLDRSAIPLIGSMVVAWALVAWRARHDVGHRMLLIAALALSPAAIYAASRGLNARNFAGLAVLSAIAIGVGGAWLVGTLRARWVVATPAVGARAFPPRPLAALVLAGVALVSPAIALIGQRDLERQPADRLPEQLSGWLAANTADGDRIAMAFRDREQVAVRRFDHTDVALLPAVRVDPMEPPESYLWMGLRDQQLFGYRRTDWVAALTDPAVDLLILVAPHPLTPVELTATPQTASRLGLTPAATFETDGDRAEIDRVDSAVAVAGTPAVPLHLSVDAAGAWLALRDGDAATGFLAARPVVVGSDGAIRALLDRLGGRGCSQPAERSAAEIRPAGSCGG